MLETAQYVRKLSSKPSSLTSSICSNSGKVPKVTGKSLLLSAPIPGSPITRPSMLAPTAANTMSSTPKSIGHATGPSSQFYDEIERHRLVVLLYSLVIFFCFSLIFTVLVYQLFLFISFFIKSVLI